jgi:hypothetical protein
LLVCLGLPASLGAVTAEAWETLAPEGMGFRVDMPRGAVYDATASMTLAGRIVEHRYWVKSADAAFWVTWTRLPRVALWLARRDGILGSVRKDVLSRDGVEEVAWVATTLGEIEGRELRYTLERGKDERHGRLRVFLRDRTLYVFHGQARTPEGSRQLERLLRSIGLEPNSAQTKEPADARGDRRLWNALTKGAARLG